jgi:hypothetical protein
MMSMGRERVDKKQDELGLNEGNQQPIPQERRIHPDTGIRHRQAYQPTDLALPHSTDRLDNAQLLQSEFDLARLGELAGVTEKVEENAVEMEGASVRGNETRRGERYEDGPLQPANIDQHTPSALPLLNLQHQLNLRRLSLFLLLDFSHIPINEIRALFPYPGRGYDVVGESFEVGGNLGAAGEVGGFGGRGVGEFREVESVCRAKEESA